MSRPRSKSTARGTAIRWGSGGDALVRLDDGTEAWAHGVVPGDVATFRTSRDGRRVFATVETLVTPSADRVDPPCPLVDRCGGCPWMVARPALVRSVKLAAVRRAVGEGTPVEWHASPSPVAYRRRARLSFERSPKGLLLGYRAPRSRAIVDVPSCVILDDALAAALPAVRETLASAEGPGEARLARGKDGAPTLAVVADVPQPQALYAALRAAVDSGRFAGASLRIRDLGTAAEHGDCLERTPALDGSWLVGTRDGFSQVNDAVALAMARVVRDWAAPSGASVLELYAGHGHLSVGLAAGARSFTALEIASEAAEALRRNLADRSLAARVIAADASGAPADPVDVVVLDPPRTGAAEAIPRVVAASPSRVVMASCDPRTLERDVRALHAAGYEVERAAAFDMFPGTPHVESVVLLGRRPS